MTRVRAQNVFVLFLVLAAPLTAGSAASRSPSLTSELRDASPVLGNQHSVREKLLYVVAINSGDDENPDFLTAIGADPSNTKQYGRILSRTDLAVGDNVHHFGYSLDQERLLIPGLFSTRMHVVDVRRPRRPQLVATRKNLVRKSGGYIAPHTVTAIGGGLNLVSMVGSDTLGGPAGLILLDDETGAFRGHFGPGPDHDGEPKDMYDIAINFPRNRMVTTAWGDPHLVFESPYTDPSVTTLNVWNFNKRRIIQTVDVGGTTLEADWLHDADSPYGYAAGAALLLWEDEDGDGFLEFHEALPPGTFGFLCDITISPDDRFIYTSDWFNDRIQQWDITDVYHPVLVADAAVPHPCMMRLSLDGKRLYVTNSVLGTVDDDPLFGSSNDRYGVYVFKVDTAEGGLSSLTSDGSPWVDFSNVQKKNGKGPAGPHMIVFDPGVDIGRGHH